MMTVATAAHQGPGRLRAPLSFVGLEPPDTQGAAGGGRAASARDAAGATDRKARVLVIDDEVGIRELLGYELSEAGFDVTAVESGQAAVRVARGRKFDVAITDLTMPGMDGIATVAALKQIAPDLEVVVATGYATVDSAVACMKAGAYDHICKPFDVQELIGILRRAVEKGHLQSLVALYEMSKSLSSTAQHDEIVRRALDLANRVLAGDGSGLVAGAGATSWSSARLELPAYLASIAERTRALGVPLRLPRGEEGIAGSVIAFPLDVLDRWLGTLVVVRSPQAPGFTESDQSLGAVLASQIAIALDRERLDTELRLAHRLEGIGQLAAGIAHEINTPLQYVSDNVHFLRASFDDLEGLRALLSDALGRAIGGEDPRALLQAVHEREEQIDLSYLAERMPKAFDSTRDGLARITRLVQAMREFGRRDSTEKQAVDLNRAIVTTLEVARNEYKYVADVETVLGEMPLVICLGAEMNQVLLNLIVNAAHAIADVVANSGAKGKIRIRTQTQGGDAVVRIEDTGTGIPKSIQPRIFDPFFTTKPVGRGTGQGLSIARSIVVDKHRGSLTFETEMGKGTTFTVRIPIDGGPDEKASSSR